ncbi:MAG: CoA pyrophosphatase [Burkholderiaceae bacterium]
MPTPTPVPDSGTASSSVVAGAAASAPRMAIREPHLAPVVGRDGHLPPVPPDRLQPDALRARFASTLRLPAGAGAAESAWNPELTGDAGPFLEPLREAAVLIALVRRPQGLTVLLTRRADDLNHHAGQISFPGGGRDPGDADAIATALREAREEVGLAADEVEIIGRLPLYTTVTAYAVTPIVGLLAPPRALAPDPLEVADVFETPLEFLMDPANHRRHAITIQGAERHFLSMPWGSDARGAAYFIWGATAAMLRNLYRFLA